MWLSRCSLRIRKEDNLYRTVSTQMIILLVVEIHLANYKPMIYISTLVMLFSLVTVGHLHEFSPMRNFVPFREISMNFCFKSVGRLLMGISTKYMENIERNSATFVCIILLY